MQRQCDNALELARFLQGLGGDIEVNYPGLEGEALITKLRKSSSGNGYGAIVTVRTGSKRRLFHYQFPEYPADHLQHRRYEDSGDPSGIHHRGTHLR